MFWLGSLIDCLRNVNNAEACSFYLLIGISGRLAMSRKRKDQGPMPAASAGLLRFFEEETEGIKVRPELLMIIAVGLIVVSILGKVF